uniref:Predicted protein n=1 Tax=Hordeum vulgare subsp. vulgare TaxID=112509 RepID=F2E0S3_HORVV|nr:predicted protein [Hordeum vulgare subsp. vulgare]
MKLGPKSITKNELKIQGVKILIKNTTGDYLINGVNYTGIETGYVTAMPILFKNDTTKYEGHVAYFHPTIFNKQLVPSNLDLK